MKRQRIGQSSSRQFYQHEFLTSIGKLLPRRGLRLIADDGRVRWSDRLLVMMAILMGWPCGTLKDCFDESWRVLTSMYPTRRRGGHTYEGFIAALSKHSCRLLQIVVAHLRDMTRTVAGCAWMIEGYVVMSVDGSRVNCPRTWDNQQVFGCAGVDKTGPQQFVTTVLHVGSGLVWDWRRGGGKDAERTHLRQMIASLPPQTLLLADAGFTGYELLKELIAAGHSFVIRAGANVRLLTKLGYAVREYDGIVYVWPKGKRDSQPLVLRLVKVQEGRNGVCLLTNILELEHMSDKQLLHMYRRRWGMEVFYRSLKQTMQKRKLLSASSRNASVELDWSIVSIWVLGLLTVQRLPRQSNADCWSVARSLRVVRRVMNGRGPRRDASNLNGLRKAVKDAYTRKGPKGSRDWPIKKRLSPPSPPKIRTATDEEKQQAQQLKEKLLQESLAA